MQNEQKTIAEMQRMVAEFISEREWSPFHTPKNLSMDIAVEAAELMELFMWCTTEGSFEVLKARRVDVEDELADVLIGLLAFANAANIDVFQAFASKLEKTKRKYPIEQSRGRAEKYTSYMKCKEGVKP